MTPAPDQAAISTEASPNGAALAWVPWLQVDSVGAAGAFTRAPRAQGSHRYRLF